MVEVSEERFEELVSEALDTIPPELLKAMSNIVVLVDNEPPLPEDTHTHWEGELLGLYEGVPLTERGQGWEFGALPDRVYLFRGPLQRMCADEVELRNQVAITVVHELAHHFGIDDERLHDLGWA